MACIHVYCFFLNCLPQLGILYLCHGSIVNTLVIKCINTPRFGTSIRELSKFSPWIEPATRRAQWVWALHLIFTWFTFTVYEMQLICKINERKHPPNSLQSCLISHNYFTFENTFNIKHRRYFSSIKLCVVLCSRRTTLGQSVSSHFTSHLQKQLRVYIINAYSNYFIILDLEIVLNKLLYVRSYN